MEKLNEDLKNNNLKQAYLFYGVQTYLVRVYKERVRHALGMDEDTMNFSAFEGKDINPKEIIDLAETMPFFAEKRLILIENSGWFKLEGGSKGSTSDPQENDPEEKEDTSDQAGKKPADIIADYIAQLPETVVFLFTEGEVDRRSKMFKAVAKAGSAVEFTTPDDNTLRKWIGGRIRKEGKGMTEEAYRTFIDKTGPDMENIDRELEKLLCYCMDKDSVSVADVEAITTEQIESKVFAMVDAIAGCDKKKALELYYDLLALKEPPMKILALITRQFRTLSVVKAMTNQGFGNKDIAEKAGCPEWAVRKNQGQCRNFSLEQLKRAVSDGVFYEESVKTSQMKDQLAVELFIVTYSAKKRMNG